MYSVMIARYKFFPEVKTKGMAAAPRLVLFTSEHVSQTITVPEYYRIIIISSAEHIYIKPVDKYQYRSDE